DSPADRDASHADPSPDPEQADSPQPRPRRRFRRRHGRRQPYFGLNLPGNIELNITYLIGRQGGPIAPRLQGRPMTAGYARLDRFNPAGVGFPRGPPKRSRGKGRAVRAAL